MNKNLPTVIAFVAGGAMIIGALASRGGAQAPAPTPAGGGPVVEAPVTIPDGAQVVTVTAKGGYTPGTQTAKAGVPTYLKVQTSGTYDCSTSLRIPSLGVSKRLPPNGETVIALGTPAAGTLLGTCSMGMYRFEVNFS